jgi:hypothetical protein
MMNLTKLHDQLDHRLRILPEPVTWGETGYVPVDDNWRLIEVTGGRIALENERTRQRISLSPDHVHSFTLSPPDDHSFDGFLELKVRIDLTPPVPKIDLILSGAARTIERQSMPPLRVRITDLLKKINPDILKTFETDASQTAVMISERHLALLRELQNENGFSDVLSLESTGSMSMGVGSRIGGYIHDLDDIGVCHGYIVRFKGP